MSSCSLVQKEQNTNQPVSDNTAIANNTEAQAVNTETREIEVSTYEQDLKKVSSKIKESEEFKSCMDMNVPMCIQNAGMQLAQSSKSVEFCNELSTQEQKESCVFAVTIIKLQETKDKNLCEDLSGVYKNECTKLVIQTEAVEKNDSTLCKKLSQETWSNERGGDDPVDYCIMSVVASSQNPKNKECDEITSNEIKEMCIMTVKNRENMRKLPINTQN